MSDWGMGMTFQQWAAGILKNMARSPKGSDRDQMKAVVAGLGDLAIVNTYYVGKLLTSPDSLDAQGNESSGPFIHHHTGTKVGMPRKANAQRSIARSWRKYRISNA